MIDEGVLENPKVDAAFGIHLWAPLKSGQVGLANASVMAANEEVELTIIGKPGHTSAPQEAVDPILVAGTVLQSLQSIQTRETSVLAPTLIMFGRIQGGTGRNIIADKVELGGTIRFLYENELQEKEVLKAKFERVVKGICEAMRAEYEIRYIPSNPSVLNNPDMVKLVESAVRQTYGNTDCITAYQCLAGDDFAEFTHRVPSAYYFLGYGESRKGYRLSPSSSLF